MRKAATFLTGLAFAAVAASSPALAQAPQGEVVVTAPSPKAVPQMVERFGERFSGDRLARWSDPICPYVIGLTQEHDAFIAGRIGEVAKAAGLRIAKGECEPNIMVAITSTPDALRATMAKQRNRIFGDGRWGVNRLQLADFVRSDGAAAHVFYVNGESWVGIGGTTQDEGGAASAPGLSSIDGPPVRQSHLPSRLSPHVEPSLQRVILVLDGRKLADLPVSQIAGYAAVVTLAEIRIAEPIKGVQSITTLFADLDAGRTPAPDITFWDRSYLGALYGAESQADFSAQRSAISNRIAHAIAVLDVPPATPAVRPATP